ncbi:hypothetical protein NLM31_29765 [Bradyrhizobium sp. CCGUVB4N]|uniref:hypothetical protein n=1 Tax=Bradyrhizobium sp. CCGUVB4N TaxID=2949631 RepID=UPI0020B2B6A6|nr:hypothetical protein [Bradyrhizobium sp. CCGUVB4N]MCP3384567.1 hypothetical protein [Bradyrhizobium sp. CCGUVB4N]
MTTVSNAAYATDVNKLIQTDDDGFRIGIGDVDHNPHFNSLLAQEASGFSSRRQSRVLHWLMIRGNLRTALRSMGTWACYGLMLWLLAKLWPVLLALGG